MRYQIRKVRNFYDKFNLVDFDSVVQRSKPPLMIRNFFDGDIHLIEKFLFTMDEIKNKRILEVGCGSGRLLSFLSDEMNDVVGIDFSKNQLRIAKRNCCDKKEKINLKLMDANRMGFEDNEFDISICLNNTLGNMPGIEIEVIREMNRVTKIGGKIIVRVFSDTLREVQLKNYKRLGFTGIREINKTVVTEEGFYSRRFTKRDLKRIFTVAGLDVHISEDNRGGLLAVTTKL